MICMCVHVLVHMCEYVHVCVYTRDVSWQRGRGWIFTYQPFGIRRQPKTMAGPKTSYGLLGQ